MQFENIFFALAAGILPALVWLWFWLKEDRLHPEPRRVLLKAFLGGMIAVPLVIPFQKYVLNHFQFTPILMFGIWAAIEELFKFGASWFTALKTRANNEPIDAMIYLLTTALGFAALENALFLLTPIAEGNIQAAIITGNFRFLGASLLHVAASTILGTMIALSFYRSKMVRYIYIACGLVGAIVLHTAFNLFIIEYTKYPAFSAFVGVWIAVVLLMLLFEKAKGIYPRT